MTDTSKEDQNETFSSSSNDKLHSDESDVEASNEGDVEALETVNVVVDDDNNVEATKEAEPQVLQKKGKKEKSPMTGRQKLHLLISVLVFFAVIILGLAVGFSLAARTDGTSDLQTDALRTSGNDDIDGKDPNEPQIVPGRPFVDESGSQIQAQVCRTTTDASRGGALPFSSPTTGATWSTSSESHHVWNTKTSSSNDSTKALAEEWTRRGLGEHASIAAFAAFAIALVTNQAPPQLVQDAFAAGQDEIRHAQISFEIATKLLGEPVEPGPMPPTMHHFDQSLDALALATAQEGCIDETLSALLVAWDVEVEIDSWNDISDDVKNELKETVRKIALDEARHSGLAWRTVAWAVQKDAHVWESIEQQGVFSSKWMDEAFAARFEGKTGGKIGQAKRAWRSIREMLIPFVDPTIAADDSTSRVRVSCSGKNDNETSVGVKARSLDDSKSNNFLFHLVEVIVHETYCPSNPVH